MNQLDLQPSNLLPHEHPMILIDTVIGFGDKHAMTQVTPLPGKPFANKDGNIPAWVGMEYMAQTIGIYAGIRGQQSGQPPKVGFLLGSRAYDVFIEYFTHHQTYTVCATQSYESDGLSAFDCTITHCENGSDIIIAKAVINTFQPDNIDDFLETETL